MSSNWCDVSKYVVRTNTFARDMKYVLVLSLSNLDFICLERISLHGEYICAWKIPRKVVFF